MSDPDFPQTRLVLVRHGESTVTVRRIIGGPLSCVGLSDLGRQQAERLHDRLREFVQVDAGTWRLARYNDGAHLAGLPKETPPTDRRMTR